MKLKRSSLRLAVLLFLGAAAYFLGLDYIQRETDRDLDSEDLEVAADLPPLSDSTFTVMHGRSSSELEKKRYKQAVSAVVLMAGWRGMTPEQNTSLRNSILNLKVTLASAALEGDTNAVEALDFFKAQSPAGR